VYEALSSLVDQKHSYKTVIIDSLDALEPLIWKTVSDENGWKNIESRLWQGVHHRGRVLANGD
jgi:hypothetical protein